MKEQKKGISLIVLVITIIVMIILATAVIITLSSTNIITKAREAVLQTDVKNFEQELSISLADKKLADSSVSFADVNATTLEEIKEYIPDFNKKYEGKIFILNGEIVYDASVVTSDEKEALEAIGVTAGKIYTPAEIKAIIESKNLGADISTTDITPYVEGISNKEAKKYTIFRGDLYYRYEKTTYEEQLELHAAEICILLGDANEDGTLTIEDENILFKVDTDGEIPKLYTNLMYVCNFDGGWDMTGEYVNIEWIIVDNTLRQEYILDLVPLEYQKPGRIKFIGDYTYFIYMYLTVSIPRDLNTTEYSVMKEYFPDMTEAQSTKFAIVNGDIVYRADVLTEEEKTWADESSIPYV